MVMGAAKSSLRLPTKLTGLVVIRFMAGLAKKCLRAPTARRVIQA
jgi:hypothetical protein